MEIKLYRIGAKYLDGVSLDWAVRSHDARASHGALTRTFSAIFIYYRITHIKNIYIYNCIVHSVRGPSITTRINCISFNEK